MQMGYANPEQVAGGLLSRLYSRAFIVADPEGSARVAFVSVDIGMVSQRVRLEVPGCLLPLGSPRGDAVSLLEMRMDFARSSSGKIAIQELQFIHWNEFRMNSRNSLESQIRYPGASNEAGEGGREVVESSKSSWDGLGFTSGWM